MGCHYPNLYLRCQLRVVLGCGEFSGLLCSVIHGIDPPKQGHQNICVRDSAYAPASEGVRIPTSKSSILFSEMWLFMRNIRACKLGCQLRGGVDCSSLPPCIPEWTVFPIWRIDMLRHVGVSLLHA